jgi:hypothetical protein
VADEADRAVDAVADHERHAERDGLHRRQLDRRERADLRLEVGVVVGVEQPDRASPLVRGQRGGVVDPELDHAAGLDGAAGRLVLGRHEPAAGVEVGELLEAERFQPPGAHGGGETVERDDARPPLRRDERAVEVLLQLGGRDVRGVLWLGHLGGQLVAQLL